LLLSLLTYKSINSPPPSHDKLIHKPTTRTPSRILSPDTEVSQPELSANKGREAIMVNAKRLAQLAKKWQRMAAMSRKRITQTTVVKIATKECRMTTSVAVKGHCVMYTTDGGRFEVPLAYLGTVVFGELLRMSQEEFGFSGDDDGHITVPCNATVMEYAMCLLRRDASTEVVRAFLSSIARPYRFDGGVGLSQLVAVC
jgi:hypothetical protein